MAKVKDGWHKVCGREIYTEDGVITRAMKRDRNAGLVPAFTYRRNAKWGGWDSEEMTIEAFRAGLRRNTVDVF